MANRVLVSVQDGISAPLWLENVEPFVHTVLETLSFDREEISVLFCGDDFMQELNKTYRGIDRPTDVLSFENGEEYEDENGLWLCAGDIAVSLDMLPKNAAYFETDMNTELKRLLIHGILHLNGMDHEPEHIEKGIPPKCGMLCLQEKTVAALSAETVIG